MGVNVDSNKAIYPEFGKNILDVCKDDHDEIPLVDISMDLPPHKLQEMTCIKLVLICLEFIMHLIESACPSLLLPKLDYLL